MSPRYGSSKTNTPSAWSSASTPLKIEAMYGMWHSVLAAKMTSAAPCDSRTPAAVDSSKKSFSTSTPPARAISATPPEGSKPSCRTPASLTVFSMTPSLQPISTTNGSACRSSVRRNRSAVALKCSRILDEPDEW